MQDTKNSGSEIIVSHGDISSTDTNFPFLSQVVIYQSHQNHFDNVLIFLVE